MRSWTYRVLLGLCHEAPERTASRDVEPAIEALQRQAVTEDRIIHMARVLTLRDERFIGDDGEGQMIHEPGCSIDVSKDIEFLRGRYMQYAHGQDAPPSKPTYDFTSAMVFAVRDWLSNFFGVPVKKETPDTWHTQELIRQKERRKKALQSRTEP